MKRKTILKHEDFFTPRSGVFGRNEYFVARVKPAKIPGDARYGIISSKRTFRLAVDRNRAKRLLRDWISYGESLMVPELDYIFIPFATVLNANRDAGRDAMVRALKRIARLYKKYGLEG